MMCEAMIHVVVHDLVLGGEAACVTNRARDGASRCSFRNECDRPAGNALYSSERTKTLSAAALHGHRRTSGTGQIRLHLHTSRCKLGSFTDHAAIDVFDDESVISDDRDDSSQNVD